MARAFAGLMGSSYYAPQQPNVGAWMSALPGNNGYGTNSATYPFAGKLTSQVQPLTQFKKNMQTLDPTYAQATWFDDPGNMMRTVEGTWGAYNTAAAQAGYNPVSLPSFLQSAFAGNKEVLEIYSRLFPQLKVSPEQQAAAQPPASNDWLQGRKPSFQQVIHEQ